MESTSSEISHRWLHMSWFDLGVSTVLAGRLCTTTTTSITWPARELPTALGYRTTPLNFCFPCGRFYLSCTYRVPNAASQFHGRPPKRCAASLSPVRRSRIARLLITSLFERWHENFWLNRGSFHTELFNFNAEFNIDCLLILPAANIFIWELLMCPDRMQLPSLLRNASVVS